jgi:hypothetical protein
MGHSKNHDDIEPDIITADYSAPPVALAVLHALGI